MGWCLVQSIGEILLPRMAHLSNIQLVPTIRTTPYWLKSSVLAQENQNPYTLCVSIPF